MFTTRPAVTDVIVPVVTYVHRGTQTASIVADGILNHAGGRFGSLLLYPVDMEEEVVVAPPPRPTKRRKTAPVEGPREVPGAPLGWHFQAPSDPERQCAHTGTTGKGQTVYCCGTTTQKCQHMANTGAKHRFWTHVGEACLKNRRKYKAICVFKRADGDTFCSDCRRATAKSESVEPVPIPVVADDDSVMEEQWDATAKTHVDPVDDEDDDDDSDDEEFE